MRSDTTIEQSVATIRRISEKEFADHVLTERTPPGALVRMWHCAKPGTSIYAFRVVSAPGALMIYGDLGEVVLRPHDSDAIGWLQKSIGSRDYVLGKVSPHFVREEFYVGEAVAAQKRLADEIAESYRHRPDWAKRADAILDCWHDTGDNCPHDFQRALSNAGVDDPPDGMGPTSHMLWMYEALRWFVGALNQTAAKAA